MFPFENQKEDMLVVVNRKDRRMYVLEIGLIDALFIGFKLSEKDHEDFNSFRFINSNFETYPHLDLFF